MDIRFKFAAVKQRKQCILSHEYVFHDGKIWHIARGLSYDTLCGKHLGGAERCAVSAVKLRSLGAPVCSECQKRKKGD